MQARGVRPDLLEVLEGAPDPPGGGQLLHGGVVADERQHAARHDAGRQPGRHRAVAPALRTDVDEGVPGCE
jgi:hypothetical protein